MKKGEKKGRAKYMPAPDERDVRDLYYLDELIKDMLNERMIVWGTKHMTFIHDWYDELRKKVNHTDEQRHKYIVKQFGKEVVNEFLTEEEIELFLKHDL